MDDSDAAGREVPPLSTQGLPFLHGGALCLDLVNTVDMRLPDPAGRQPGQYLRSYGDLARWGWNAGAIDESIARGLIAAGERDPGAGELALAAAFELREAIYRIFAAVARGESAPPADLDALRVAYGAALSQARLAPADGRAGYRWEWPATEHLDRVIWPVALSAVELLMAPEIARVKACGGCGWLFLDRSKNDSRRWCSMDECGSRDKMRRHYARRRDKQRQ